MRRKVGFEAHGQFAVVIRARDELVDVERAAVPRIDEPPRFRVAFHRARLAAPERIVRAVLELVRARHERQEIRHAAVARLRLREDVVPERAFLIVGERGARLGLEELARELEQIVRAACLAGKAGQIRALLIRAAKRFLRRDAAGRVEVVADDRLPEELGEIARRRVARQLPAAHLADDLGNERVGVLPVQLVAMRLERIEHLGMIEDAGRLNEPVGARSVTARPHEARKVEKRFGDAAELAPAHRGRLFGRKRQHLVGRPVAEAARDRERFFVAADFGLIDEALQDLVLDVPRCPHARAGDDAVDVGGRERADPAGADRILAALQFVDRDGRAGLERFVARRLIERGHAGEPVPERMAAQFHFGLFPAAETLNEICVGKVVEPGRHAEHPGEVQRIERFHDGALALQVVEERPRQEPHDRCGTRGQRGHRAHQDQNSFFHVRP